MHVKELTNKSLLLFQNFPHGAKHVHSLILRCCNISDRGLEALMEFLQALYKLEIAGCNEITEQVHILHSCSHRCTHGLKIHGGSLEGSRRRDKITGGSNFGFHCILINKCFENLRGRGLIHPPSPLTPLSASNLLLEWASLFGIIITTYFLIKSFFLYT